MQVLLRFGVRNHLSLRDKEELSLVASSLDDNATGLIDPPTGVGGRLLPLVVIYGANGSGKTNLLEAFRFMRRSVLTSHSQGGPGDNTGRIPFLLDPESVDKPSTFDVDFIIDNTRYHYGFTASSEAFISEWLTSFPSGRSQTLFERDGTKFFFGRNLRGRNKLISDLTRSNSLFVSAAAQNDHEELSKVDRFFRSILIPSNLLRGSDDSTIDKRIIDFLSNIGTGVVDYRRIEREIPEDIKDFTRELINLLQKVSGNLSHPDLDLLVNRESRGEIEFGHRGRDGRSVYLNLNLESAGTRRLLNLLGPIYRSLDEGALVLVDELNASLHTQACEAILAMFTSRATNPRGAQLITTTHDTNILRSSLLRRDQVWFTEKDDAGATHVYPLTDFRTRKGDNLERGYLQGRYGAIPFAGSASSLVSVC